MFARQARTAARSGARFYSTVNAQSQATDGQFKALRDATKAHAHSAYGISTRPAGWTSRRYATVTAGL